MNANDFSGFYKLSLEQRLAILKKNCSLSDAEIRILGETGSLSHDTANGMVENAIGAVHLPIGIATNFRINGKDMVIPMAIEEPSVIAGASKAAKLALPGGFEAGAENSTMIGQIQLVGIKDPKKTLAALDAKKHDIMKIAKEHTKGMEKYSGGARGVEFKPFKTPRGEMIVAYFYVDVGDAMGANTINTLLEAITPTIEEYSLAKSRLRILSNLATRRLAKASATWKKADIGEEAIEGVLDAYEFANADPYRCATHNKGIMNGISSVAVATGNDWRAIEAGAHAYASLNGYHSLTKYEKTKDGDLKGSIELPIAAGTVGGAINTLPTAKIALKILGAKSAKELAMAMACAGLANNFAAIYALATTGIQAGHMKLHARNIAIIAGASSEGEIEGVAEILAEKKNYSTEFAKETLKKIKGKM